jgi:hypothetical protein
MRRGPLEHLEPLEPLEPHASVCIRLPDAIRATLCPPLRPSDASHASHASHDARRLYDKVMRLLTDTRHAWTWSTLSNADRLAVLDFRHTLVQLIKLRCRQCSAWGSDTPRSDVDFTVFAAAAPTAPVSSRNISSRGSRGRSDRPDMTRSVAIIGRVFHTLVRIFPGVSINRILAFFDINFYFTNFALPRTAPVGSRSRSGSGSGSGSGSRRIGDLDQYHVTDAYEGAASQFRFAFFQLVHSPRFKNAALSRRYRAWLSRTLTGALGTTAAAAAAACEWTPAMGAEERALLSQYFHHPAFPCLMRDVDAVLAQAQAQANSRSTRSSSSNSMGAQRERSNRLVLLTSLLSCLEEESYRTQGAYCYVVLQQQEQKLRRLSSSSGSSNTSDASDTSDACPLVSTDPQVQQRVLPCMLLACALENTCFAAAKGSGAAAAAKYLRRADAALRHHPDHRRLGLRVPAVPAAELADLASALLEALLSVKPTAFAPQQQQQLVTDLFSTASP